MDALLRFDTELFPLINHLPHTSGTDALALALSGIGAAGIIWFFFAIVLFLKEEVKDHRFFAPIVTAGLVSWIFSEKLIKPLVARLRPTPEMGATIIGFPPHDYSFPSGHATMSFAAAVVLSRAEPRWRWFFYILAILSSLSRIYLGKHYPLDVLIGALLGWGIGRLSLYATQRKTT